MSYRVEMAVSGRAGCQDAECKKAGIKIDKDELRFGTWVEIQEHGGWRWKHWGCVSGKQLQSIRAMLDPAGTGNYQWDRLDGYDSGDRGSLDAHPDLQEKVRRVITQGYIDPEDFNGDAEMNKLGETGIRTDATKKKMREDAKARTHEIDELKAKVATAEAERDALKETAKKKPASKKRAKKEESDEEDAFEESKPAPKKRATKVKKEEVDSDGEPAAEVKPKAKRGRKSAVKEETLEEQNSLDDAPEAKPKSPSKKGSKKAVKKEVVDETNGVVDTPQIAAKPKPKPAAKKSRKNGVKEEEPEVEAAVPKSDSARAIRSRARTSLKNESQ